jgi:outer membrane protein assembly factor BamE (lipoprotein component of BamABCDE complex)
MVPPTFDQSRWDYYYYLKSSRLQRPVTVRLTVWFENDRVSRIDKDPSLTPSTPSPSDAEPAPAPAG